MNPKLYQLLSLFITTIILVACSSDNAEDNSPNIPYTDIDSASGFSSEYLNGKSFFRPEDYFGNDFIYSYRFSGSSISWSDDLFDESGNAVYSIVSHNGINGILEYYDGVYDLHYNIFSVETDHLKLCYTYTGIDTVIACDESTTLKWYFDRTTAENNFP